MAPRNTGRIFGALTLLAFLLPLTTVAGCKLFNRQKKQFGEDCATDTDCDSMECATYGSVCTKTCVYDKECGAGFVCRARDGKPGDACAKPTGNTTGQTCTNPAQCASGNCLKRSDTNGDPNAEGICSAHCQTEADCPEGYKFCHDISDSNGVGFCLPGSGGGSIAIPGSTATAPVYIAPRPVTTTTKTATTSAVPTVTATNTPTGNFLHPTSTATATAAPTATATAAPTGTATTKPTASSTATTTKRPPLILKPIKK